MESSRSIVNSSPSFSLGLEYAFENVKERGPFPLAAAETQEMQVDSFLAVFGDINVSPGPAVVCPVVVAPVVVAPVVLGPVGPGEVRCEDFQSLLVELDDVLLDEWVEAPWKGSKGVSKASRTEFLDPDTNFRTTVAQGGDNPSVNQNKWALNRLKKFRQHLGHDISVELADMPPVQAVDILSVFFEQVTKANGQLYPSGSLMNLLGGFNRVLRRKQEERIMASGIDEAPFSMKTSPLFRRVCVACVLSMRRSRAQGVGTERKQVEVVAKKSETEILGDQSMAKTHSRGLFRRTGYYCMFRYSIRGGGELHGLTRSDFTFGEDSNGKYVQYSERSSKNGKATMSRFQPEHFRGGIKNYEQDVVETFEQYYRHLPNGTAVFFLGAIDNPRTPAWYNRLPMGKNTLSLLVKQIIEENGLDANAFSNKSGRTTLVTRMAEAGVPNEVGMLVTGHQNEKSYARYDRSKEAKVRAAQRCATEESLTYVQALEQENRKLRSDMIEGSCSESPPKKLKSGEESGSERVSLKLSSLKLDSGSVTSIRTGVTSTGTGESPVLDVSIGGILEKKERGKRARDERKEVQDAGEWDWMGQFDWEDDLKCWEEGRTLIVNPISALLGKLVNCDGLVINFNGDVHFKS